MFRYIIKSINLKIPKYLIIWDERSRKQPSGNWHIAIESGLSQLCRPTMPRLITRCNNLLFGCRGRPARSLREADWLAWISSSPRTLLSCLMPVLAPSRMQPTRLSRNDQFLRIGWAKSGSTFCTASASPMPSFTQPIMLTLHLWSLDRLDASNQTPLYWVCNCCSTDNSSTVTKDLEKVSLHMEWREISNTQKVQIIQVQPMGGEHAWPFICALDMIVVYFTFFSDVVVIDFCPMSLL